MIRRFYNAVKKRILHSQEYDFTKSNPLGGDGERVDIFFSDKLNFSKLDIYQKSHIKRYRFAKENIREGDICADWACGTGYGSVLLSSKASRVIGVDINAIVINKIKERYKNNSTVFFETANLLDLQYHNFFDVIVSFETIEHFTENNIPVLFAVYNKALKPSGKIIFSTPYLQEKSEDAIRMGFHHTFDIDERKISSWLQNTGFGREFFFYQDYQTHHVKKHLDKKDFILCLANKVD